MVGLVKKPSPKEVGDEQNKKYFICWCDGFACFGVCAGVGAGLGYPA